MIDVPDNYLKIIVWLTNMGVEAVFDVSFGAELTIKSYREHVHTNNSKTVIALPCPAIVTYIQIYKPNLFKYLAPAHSQMLHTIQMVELINQSEQFLEFLGNIKELLK